MLENQIILKTVNKGKESNVYPIFPKQTVHQGNQIIDKVWVLFIEVFQLINEEGIIKLDYLQLLKN